ncbi:LysR family transcriptional regulator [Paraglaciecola chathamensis]|jgi:DNA-binding transcriptional LysR family regulator|uniref:HTH lysR-type domain-containing protein n=1 Tax=Paraglaciecola agarilytica NO2 TaxID=1125747 RepID=A0ABQ0IBX9_9ALTE|nr:LysR family transcriptional regulator [Paraglaciecola agarilytica]GAC06890.1 hypothetical protein GAGA_4057 [Paraglaciecola agarilytica NO2]
MTLEQLKAFSAVVKYGSVRAASSEIYKSAPSISAAIKALEFHIGLPLFSREGYRLNLTKDGVEFHAKVKQILRVVNELDGFSRRKGKLGKQSITMAIDASVPQVNLVNIIAQVSEMFPDTQLNITTEYHGNALQKVLAGNADLALTPLWGSTDETIEAKHIASVPIFPVALANSRIANLPKPIKMLDILDETQIVLGTLAGFKGHSCGFKIAGAKSLSVTDMNTKRSLILSGLGWGELPQHLVAEQLAEGSLATLNIENHGELSLEQYLVRCRKGEHSNIASGVWNCVNVPEQKMARSAQAPELIECR